jgi:hypothetical protein
MKTAKRRGAKNKKILGFTILEAIIGVVVFAIFAFGVYEGVRFVYKVVYISRLRIVETSILSARLELARNMEYADIGIVNGIPLGKIPHTATINKNGIIFNLMVTVRNIDDPFDGTVTTTPQDTAPADYKLVEMSIICANCIQHEPVILNTIVAPKGLENDTNNGALFIQVFNKYGIPVEGAKVQVVKSDNNPPLSFEDTTGNDGWLRIFDTPTGTLDYRLTVTKDGYSSDYTVDTTDERPIPRKPHITVQTKTVSEAFFSIDLLANLTVKTITQSCGVSASREFNIWGEKLTGLVPPEPKYSQSFTTNGSGLYVLNNFEWDKYFFGTDSNSYSIGGTIPMLPLSLEPGSTQEISLIARAYSISSLLVNVTHGGTGLPLSDATVRLFSPTTSYDQTYLTGLGYERQTDWSGGSGQQDYSAENKYFSDDGNVAVNDPAGDIKLKQTGPSYVPSGWLESSTFDLGEEVNFQNLIWEPVDQPVQAGETPVRFQIATSNSSSPAGWDFYGPDGTAGSYYTPTSTLIFDGHDGQRYFRYRAYLSTADTAYTPHLSEISFTYTNTCLPPGQVYFSGLSDQDYEYEISHSGFVTATGIISVSGHSILSESLVSE